MDKIFICICLIIVVLSGCVYNNEEELYPGGCNTTGVGYSAVVLPIIQNNCYICHDAANNQGGITLEGYSKIKVQVDNGALLGAIKREPGFSPMPQNAPKLSDCNIAKIQEWVNQGALDN